MSRSIHQRVRAALEAKTRAEKQARDRAHDALVGRLERRAMRREERIDALCSGEAIPRNAAEQAIQDRARFYYLGDI